MRLINVNTMAPSLPGSSNLSSEHCALNKLLDRLSSQYHDALVAGIWPKSRSNHPQVFASTDLAVSDNHPLGDLTTCSQTELLALITNALSFHGTLQQCHSPSQRISSALTEGMTITSPCAAPTDSL